MEKERCNGLVKCKIIIKNNRRMGEWEGGMAIGEWWMGNRIKKYKKNVLKSNTKIFTNLKLLQEGATIS